MDPTTPRDAQTIVAAYLKIAEAHAAAETYPGSLRDLPHPKETIRAAFRTSMTALGASDQLTPELRDYLEVAYVSLADYVEDEGVTLLREFRRSGEELAADGRMGKEKVATEAWQRIAEQGRLAGQLARAISDEADRLRAEFRAWQESARAAGA